MRQRITWPLKVLLGALFSVVLVYGISGRGHVVARAALAGRPPRPLARDDADRDGLPDTLEATLAARYAPVVILDPRERNRPASIDWLLARVTRLETDGGSFSEAVRAGSGDPRDWVTYVHVYPRADGRINVQFWFFYPYNEGPLFFDHESDWEHITIDVERTGEARAVYFAQHGNNSPGVGRAWKDVGKVGDHPIVLSARGTHASYPDHASLAWFERASRCTRVEACADPIWRTWEAGGLINMGERGALLGSARPALAYEGRWGGAGRFLRSRPSPRGPLQQGSFRSDGFE